MRLIVLFLLVTVGQAVAQPVTITFTIGSELATQMDSLTAEYVLTPLGPYHHRNIKKMAFQVNLPDSAIIQRLQTMNIDVYLRYKRVARVILKPQPIVSATPSSDSTMPKSGTTETEATPPYEYKTNLSAGIGVGLDYGGLGAKLTFLPTGPVSIFGGLGYNFDALGYNAGLELNCAPREQTTAFFSVMYGYNAVILQPVGSTKPSKTYYGASLGFGVKFRAKSSENFFMFQVLYPIRDEEFLNAHTTETPWPVLISLGYHFGK